MTCRAGWCRCSGLCFGGVVGPLVRGDVFVAGRVRGGGEWAGGIVDCVRGGTGVGSRGGAPVGVEVDAEVVEEGLEQGAAEGWGQAGVELAGVGQEVEVGQDGGVVLLGFGVFLRRLDLTSEADVLGQRVIQTQAGWPSVSVPIKMYACTPP